jgi:hypothetical protein
MLPGPHPIIGALRDAEGDPEALGKTREMFEGLPLYRQQGAGKLQRCNLTRHYGFFLPGNNITGSNRG